MRPYHAFVPSFGEWGFVLAAREPFGAAARATRPGLRFLRRRARRRCSCFRRTWRAVPVEVNRLDNQVLVRYYEVGVAAV